MVEGKIAIIVSDDCSRFFRGDHVRILRYLKSTDTYLCQRADGQICGEVRLADIKFLVEDNENGCK